MKKHLKTAEKVSARRRGPAANIYSRRSNGWRMPVYVFLNLQVHTPLRITSHFLNLISLLSVYCTEVLLPQNTSYIEATSLWAGWSVWSELAESASPNRHVSILTHVLHFLLSFSLWLTQLVVLDNLQVFMRDYCLVMAEDLGWQHRRWGRLHNAKVLQWRPPPVEGWLFVLADYSS